MPPSIEAHALTKRFSASGRLRDLMPARAAGPRLRAETVAVDRASLEVGAGEIFGLLGPNGAGKTTLVKMLSTLILPTSGTARINGIPLGCAEEVKASIGLMTVNERSFYPRLSCRENLHFYGGLSQLSAAEVARKVVWLSEMLDLGAFLDKRYDLCSTGMKHRLALARALLNDATLLFLDEPTVTLDPVAANQFRERLYALVHQERRTVFMVTHNVDEAVELCDRVAIMLAGRLHLVGAPDRLRDLLQSDARCELRIQGFSEALARRLAALDEVQALSHEPGAGAQRVTLCLRDRKRALPGVVAAVEAGGGHLLGLELATATWEQVAEKLAAPASVSPVGVSPVGVSPVGDPLSQDGVGARASESGAAPAAGSLAPVCVTASFYRAAPAEVVPAPAASGTAARIRERMGLPPVAPPPAPPAETLRETQRPSLRGTASSLSADPAARIRERVAPRHDERVAARIRERVGLPPLHPAPRRRPWPAWLALPARLRELARVMPLFLKRDLRTQASYRLSFLMQLAGIVFSIASYFFMAQVFGMQESPTLQAYGGDYFSFVLIGIAFLGYQGVALYTFAGVIQSAQSSGTLEAMLTTPTRLSAILLGSSAWNFAFTSFRVVLYLLVGVLFFGARFTDANFPGALIVLALTVTSLGAIGIISASFIMAFKRGNPLNFLIGGASTLLGGVYYPVEVLPPWLQAVARLYPLTTSLQAMRRALLTGASLRDLLGEIGVLLAFTLVLLPLSLAVFRYAVQQAKRDGSLTHF